MGVGRSTTNALLGPPSKGVGGAGTPGREEGGRSANGHSATHQAAWVVGVNHGSGGAAVVAWLREDRKHWKQQEQAKLEMRLSKRGLETVQGGKRKRVGR